jgi:hypothetical protein
LNYALEHAIAKVPENKERLKFNITHKFVDNADNADLLLRNINTVKQNMEALEQHRLRIFMNRVLRKILGFKRNEVTGDWRDLHNKDSDNSLSSPDSVRMDELRGIKWAAT